MALDIKQKTRKVLYWGDSPLSTTGMGKVSHEILKRLSATGEYDVTCVGVHYFGASYDRVLYPYNMIVANQDGKNLLGRTTFLKELSSHDWDMVFTHQDLSNINPMAQLIADERETRGFKWIIYSPVDTDQITLDDIKCLGMANYSATYSNFGKKVVTKLSKEIGDALSIMWMGTDTDKFRPLTINEKREKREELFGVSDDDTYIVVNVNSNRLRKDLPRTILAFKLFSDKHPNSLLYIHARKLDYGGDLERVAKSTGLSLNKIYFNDKLHPTEGMEEDKMKYIYGAADIIISTSMAEGWGLSCTEALACGIPALFPKHTSLEEIIGVGGERGYFVNLSGYSFFDWNMGQYWYPICDEKHCADTMEWMSKNKQFTSLKSELGLAWIKGHTWDIIGRQWIKVFDTIGDK